MLEKICTDFKTSKKLKELEIKEYGYFSWETISNKGITKHNLTKNPFNNRTDEYQCRNSFAAYTLEQILEMLPLEIKYGNSTLELTIYRHKEEISLDYSGYYQATPEQKENLATTAARLLIELKKDKII